MSKKDYVPKILPSGLCADGEGDEDGDRRDEDCRRCIYKSNCHLFEIESGLVR